MGSFNTTCAISHSPIREGDKVRLFFLASDPRTYKFDPIHDSLNKGCQCYPHDDFLVIGGINLEATYSDYNNYSFDEKSLFARYILWIIKREYSMNVSGGIKDDDEYTNIPPDELTWEIIFNMQHSGRLYLNNYGEPKRVVGIMAIHESVYQIMMNESYEAYVGKDDDNPYEIFNYEKCLKRHLSIDENDKINEIAKSYEGTFDFMVEDGRITQEEAETKVLELAKRQMDSRSENESNYAFTRSFIPYAIMRDLLSANQDKDLGGVTLEDCKIKAYEGLYFNRRMDAHHFMYRPLLISGQDHDLVFDGVFWQKVGAAISTIGSEWEVEEHILTRKFSKSWQEVTTTEIQQCMTDWYADYQNDELHVEFQEKFSALMKDKDVVVISTEELQSNEFKYLRNFIWNKELELHIYK